MLFETQCASITAIFYTTKGDLVEIKNNALQLFNLESLFQKEHKLKTVTHWDWDLVQEKLFGKIEYGVAVGKPHSGKTTIANHLAKSMGMKVVSVEAITQTLKEEIAKRDEKDIEEVQVSNEEVEAKISEVLNAAKGSKTKYVVDGLHLIHKTQADYSAFLKKIGMPEFILNCQVSNKVGLDRYCEKNEKENNEETQAEYKALEEADLAFRPPLLEEFEKHAARCKIISLNTD